MTAFGSLFLESSLFDSGSVDGGLTVRSHFSSLQSQDGWMKMKNSGFRDVDEFLETLKLF